jgi:hypothetical protein
MFLKDVRRNLERGSQIVDHIWRKIFYQDDAPIATVGDTTKSAAEFGV